MGPSPNSRVPESWSPVLTPPQWVLGRRRKIGAPPLSGLRQEDCGVGSRTRRCCVAIRRRGSGSRDGRVAECRKRGIRKRFPAPGVVDQPSLLARLGLEAQPSRRELAKERLAARRGMQRLRRDAPHGPSRSPPVGVLAQPHPSGSDAVATRLRAGLVPGGTATSGSRCTAPRFVATKRGAVQPSRQPTSDSARTPCSLRPCGGCLPSSSPRSPRRATPR